MKNLFEIDSDEIKRILSLHEESTKKQYLNVISEQSGESITLPAGVYHKITAGTPESVINLPNGTIFSKTNDPNILITYQDEFYQAGGGKRMDGKISYNCATGKFKVSSIDKEYNELDKNGVESKYLKPFCQKGSQQNTQTQTKTDTTPKIEPKKIEKVTTSLSDDEKKRRANKMGWNDWKSYEVSGWKLSPKKVFVQNTVAGINKLQTDFLGVPTPTGQLTTKDIDTLLTKLQ